MIYAKIWIPHEVEIIHFQDLAALCIVTLFWINFQHIPQKCQLSYKSE